MSGRLHQVAGSDVVDPLTDGPEQPVVLDLEAHDLGLEIGDPTAQCGGFAQLIGGGASDVADECFGHEESPRKWN